MIGKRAIRAGHLIIEGTGRVKTSAINSVIANPAIRPTLREQMRVLTLEALRSGIQNSDRMREYISHKLLREIDSEFTNTHAWALVDLQASGRVVKLGFRTYGLSPEPPNNPFRVDPPTADPLPLWARTMVAKANRENGSAGPRFTVADLIALWANCGGRCSVTGLEFSSEPVGSSLVKRAYMVSLDRIECGSPYTRANCRLVMVAINFAMNTWGLDVYLRLAQASVRAQPE